MAHLGSGFGADCRELGGSRFFGARPSVRSSGGSIVQTMMTSAEGQSLGLPDSRSGARCHIVCAIAGLAIAWTAACQSQEQKAPPTQQKPAASAPAPAPAERGPQQGGYLKLPSPEPRFLNPVLETRLEKANMLIFEGLVGLNTRLEPEPRLAASWEQSPDGKVITFRLRKGVQWHDGKPFTADDVAFTYGAIQSSSVPTLWRAYMSAVETLETPDPHTVVVKYRYPYAPALSTWTVGILPRHAYGQGELTQSPANTEPVGTGPYKLLRWEIGKRLVLEANPAWWNGRPYIDTIELVVDTPESLEALAEGKVDFVNVENIDTWLGRAQMPDFRRTFEVSDAIESSIQLVAWNLQKKPLEDARVRQALTLAMDRSRAIEDVLLGQARPLSGPFFPTMFGADPSVAPHPFDLQRAGKLLDEAGYPSKNGKRFRIDMIALESQRGPVADGVMAIFREDLAQLGIELELELVSSRDFFQRIADRKLDAVYFTWLPDIPDPDPYSLLHSSMIGIGANFPGYANPEVDELLDQARATADRNQRRALYHKVHRIVHEELPYTPLFAPYGHYAWNRRVRGVNPADVSSQPRFPGVAGWWIAGAGERAAR
jgi:peptide/nickel transport system substrate-binding protein